MARFPAKRSAGQPDATGIESSRKIAMLAALMAIGVAVLIPYGAISLGMGREVIGAADLLIALLFAVSLFRLWRTRRSEGIAAIVTCVLGAFFFYLILLGGVEHSVWAFAFPLLALFLLGPRVGGLMIFLFLTGVLAFFLLNPADPFQAYTGEFKFRYIGAHVAVSLGAFMFEAIRIRFQREAVRRNDELTRALADLESALTALRESESKYRDLVDRANDGIAIVKDRLIRFANLRLAEILGYPVNDLLGRPVEDFLHPSCREETMSFHADRMAHRESPMVYPSSLVARDGRRIEVEFNSGLIPFEAGEAALVFIRDTTQQKRAEAENRVLEDQLRQAQKLEAIGSLAGGVAHDFNNLLGGITGHAELILLNARDSDPRTSEYAAAIRRTALRAADLTAKLLAFARRGKYEIVKLDLQAAVRDVVGLLERTISKRIVIETDLPAECMTVEGDRSQLENSILNLALNARDAMPDGGRLSFRTAVETIDQTRGAEPGCALEPGEYVRLTVEDTGVGMSPKTLERIFEPFFTTKQAGKGTGLGLASVYGTVTAHRGGISVVSEPGQGTTFTVYLPLAPGAADVAPAGVERGDCRGGSILIIDDEAVVRDVCSSMLEELGFDVHCCEDGLLGVEYFREHHETVDLVLLDLVMPGIGGLECFHRLRRISDSVSVVVASGFSREQEAQAVLAAGAKGFLPKPFSMAELSDAVSVALRA